MDALDFYGLERTETRTSGACRRAHAVLRARRAVRRLRARRVRRGARAGHRPAARVGDRPVPLLRPAAAVMDIAITEVVRGHQISQARASRTVDGDEILTVNAALGDRDIPFEGEWADPPGRAAARGLPAAPDPGPPRGHDHGPHRDAARRRRATSTSSTAPRATGRSALWVRLPGRARDVGGRARDPRRLRAVRHRPGARPPRRRQQPRQHAAGRAAACRPTGSSPTSASTRSPTASATASCTCGPRTARCSAPPASPRSSARGGTSPSEPDPRRRATRRSSDDVTQRYGITVPFDGVPLREHTRVVRGARATSATPTCGRARPAAPTRSRRSRWPRRGRRRCGSARAIVPCTPAARRCSRRRSPALAEAAPGRFALGIGTSSNVIVERWNGIPFERAVPPRARHDPVPARRAHRREGRPRSTRRSRSRASGSASRVDRAAADPRRRAARRACCSSRAARATARSSTGSRPTTCRRSRRIVGPARQGDRRPHLRAARARTATRSRHVGRRMIAAYLNVPVYAAFHEWLGRGDLLGPMWDRVEGRRPRPARPRRSPTRSSTSSSSGARPSSAPSTSSATWTTA